MTKKYKVIINRNNCIGCNVCTSLLPGAFDIDDNDGLVRLKNSQTQGDQEIIEIDEDQLEKFQEVADSCAVQVIKISE